MSKIANNLETTREVKDSGIDWIGEIPVNWEIFKLKNKYKFHTGFTPDSKNEDYYDEYGYIWVTISDLTNSKYISNSSKKISQVGLNNSKGILTPKKSLLYSFKLSIGQVAITDKDCYTNEAIASFPVKENPCIEFLYYSSQICIIKNANENIYGAKILNQELINNAWIMFPPLDEQQAIANYLDEKVGKIDEIIAEQNKTIENWKAYKQSLISETVTKGLNPNVEMKESRIEWIDEIPKEWEVIKYKNICNVFAGGTPKTDVQEYWDGDIPWIASGRVQNCLITEATRYITAFGIINSSTKMLKRGTPVLAMTGATCGNAGFLEIDTCANQSVMAFVPRKNDVFGKFIFYSLMAHRHVILSEQFGGAQAGISAEKGRNLWITLPPLHEQQAITKYLDEKCSKIDQTIKQKQVFIEQLEEYKQSLIYECVTGKRCVL